MSKGDAKRTMRPRASVRGVAVALISVAVVLSICLILLGLTGDFLVDWFWFSEVGYLNVFWTIVIAEGATFLAFFAATFIVLWVNGSLARLAQSSLTLRLIDDTQAPAGAATTPDPSDVVCYLLRRPLVIAGAAGVLAMLVAWGEVHNWNVFLRSFYQVSAGTNDPLYDQDIGFYLFSLPAFVVIKNWLLLTLLLSALLAGAIYWIQGEIEYNAQRGSLSPAAVAHGSALLGCYSR